MKQGIAINRGFFLKRCLMLAVFAAASVEAAEPRVEIPEVISAAQVQRYLSVDPAFRNAATTYDAESMAAKQTAVSPYEWNATYTQQRRSYSAGPASNEWNAGIESTFRLPSKQQADVDSATADDAAAAGRSRMARREAAQTMLNLWLDWLEAASSKKLLAEQHTAVMQNMAAVSAREKSGDASHLEQRLASAEVTEFERQANEAATREASSWAKLSARYMITGEVVPTLPDPLPVPFDGVWWQSRLVQVSDQLVVAKAELNSSQAAVRRAKADRLPDPTIGLFTGREADGEEKIVGLNLSMPLPSERRSLEVKRQRALEISANESLKLAEREVNVDAQTMFTAAVGHYRRWQLAHSSTDTLNENVHLAQRAYALGEQDLQALLLARRQALSAAEAEVGARVDALRAYYQLLMAGKMLWTDWLDSDR